MRVDKNDQVAFRGTHLFQTDSLNEDVITLKTDEFDELFVSYIENEMVKHMW